MNVLLFLNGLFPKNIPDLSPYDLIMCTDGAYDILKKHHIKPHLVSGDFDSIQEIPLNIEVIKTPDQNFTDFEKALNIIIQKKGKKVAIYGASGEEQDHFLGNLSTALKFQKKLHITFYDDYHTYFITSNNINLKTTVNQQISLYPYPTVENISTKGLKYRLLNDTLDLSNRIGIRNQAIETIVNIQFSKGTLIVFLKR